MVKFFGINFPTPPPLLPLLSFHPSQAFICRLIRAHELPAASLAEMKALLKLEKDEQRRKPTQDVASSLSVLESIERPKSPEKSSVEVDQEVIEEEWQCHRCKTINDIDDKKCTSCWASKTAFVFSASPRRRRKTKPLN